MNSERYADSGEFIPERFEGFSSSEMDYASDPDHMARDVYTFGAGRRVVSSNRQLQFRKGELIPMPL